MGKFANLKADGRIKRVNPEDVKVGEFIVVKPGEKIPLVLLWLTLQR